MIKLQPLPVIGTGSYHNFRCGEVLCNSPTSYDICCSLCGQRQPFDDFPQHFRLHHLGPAAGAATEDCKLFEAAIKIEDDPIGHESCELDEHENVDLEHISAIDEAQAADADSPPRRQRETAMKNTLVETEEALLELDPNPEWPDEASEPIENAEEDEEPPHLKDDTKDMLFQCDQCDRAYNSKRSLQSHRRVKHNDKDGAVRKRNRGPAKLYICPEPECSQTFRTERDLHGHRWKHTGIFCDICGKPFTQSGNMMRHRQRHSGIKPHKCKECEATFYTQKELTSHNICHTGRMPCICEVCGRPCRDRGVLTAHMRRHTGERPAKCDVCGKAFYSFHDLNVHAVSHTNHRPFVCDVCGSTFQRKKALRVHKLLHSDRKYPCKMCNKTFAQSGGLNAHMRTHELPKGKGTAASSSTKSAAASHKVVGGQLETVTIELIEESAPVSTTTITMAIDLNVEGADSHSKQPDTGASAGTWQVS
ncbi:zinc finger protein 568 [Drosophila guanche]|uniref:Blast:Zinc finger protein 836 n=1 Tax=Drosophila guanche TaxID=7266 RepID=A0A3B0K3V4_DROGU|nr:zinc finger protein 568 [Drosophila guanche]SPP88884.1 blast:Zinc finger protein 836 [Drosophila guanche]